MRTYALLAAAAFGLCRSSEDDPETAKLRTAAGVDLSDPMTSFSSVEDVIEKYVPGTEKEQVLRVLYGNMAKKMQVPESLQKTADRLNFQVKLETLAGNAFREEMREPNVLRVGLIQNTIVKPTTASVKEQYEGLENRMSDLIDAAGEMGVNVLGLQEAWTMPFAFATREKGKWLEFAENPVDGRSVEFIKRKAKQWGMVIVSPILERDPKHQEKIWNTAVVVSSRGVVLGKHRKNHIPRVGDFNEATYYLEGNTGHPIFETEFGKIAINICYGRHHPLNWLGFALNGAEIVFNPSATVGALSEPMWPLEGRTAAVANTYFVASNNRVGTETFPNEFTSADGKAAHKDFGHFYGSSYVAGPDASRSSSLTRLRDGVLAVDVDLNQIRQVREKWMFQMTARYEMYEDLLKAYNSEGFEPQIVRDPALVPTSRRAAVSGTGSVFEAVGVQDRKHYAVKAIQKARQKLVANENYFRNIYEFVLGKPSRFTIFVKEVLEEGETFYIVMERCFGPDMVEFVLSFDPGGIPEGECKRLMNQVLLAVNHLHSHRVLHRDIKLDNVMFRNLPLTWVQSCEEKGKELPELPPYAPQRPQPNGGGGGVKGRGEEVIFLGEEEGRRRGSAFVGFEDALVLDFDMCLFLDRKDPPKTVEKEGEVSVVGTREYMAPESYKGTYTAASDLWGCGVILFVLVDGHFPFDVSGCKSNKDVRKILKQGVRFEQNLISKFPEAVDLASSLLAYNPDSRMASSFQALHHPWLSPISRPIPLRTRRNTQLMVHSGGAPSGTCRSAAGGGGAASTVTECFESPLTSTVDFENRNRRKTNGGAELYMDTSPMSNTTMASSPMNVHGSNLSPSHDSLACSTARRRRHGSSAMSPTVDVSPCEQPRTGYFENCHPIIYSSDGQPMGVDSLSGGTSRSSAHLVSLGGTWGDPFRMGHHQGGSPSDLGGNCSPSSLMGGMQGGGGHRASLEGGERRKRKESHRERESPTAQIDLSIPLDEEAGGVGSSETGAVLPTGGGGMGVHTLAWAGVTAEREGAVVPGRPHHPLPSASSPFHPHGQASPLCPRDEGLSEHSHAIPRAPSISTRSPVVPMGDVSMDPPPVCDFSFVDGDGEDDREEEGKDIEGGNGGNDDDGMGATIRPHAPLPPFAGLLSSELPSGSPFAPHSTEMALESGSTSNVQGGLSHGRNNHLGLGSIFSADAAGGDGIFRGLSPSPLSPSTGTFGSQAVQGVSQYANALAGRGVPETCWGLVGVSPEDNTFRSSHLCHPPAATGGDGDGQGGMRDIEVCGEQVSMAFPTSLSGPGPGFPSGDGYRSRESGSAHHHETMGTNRGYGGKATDVDGRSDDAPWAVSHRAHTHTHTRSAPPPLQPHQMPQGWIPRSPPPGSTPEDATVAAAKVNTSDQNKERTHPKVDTTTPQSPKMPSTQFHTHPHPHEMNHLSAPFRPLSPPLGPPKDPFHTHFPSGFHPPHPHSPGMSRGHQQQLKQLYPSMQVPPQDPRQSQGGSSHPHPQPPKAAQHCLPYPTAHPHHQPHCHTPTSQQQQQGIPFGGAFYTFFPLTSQPSTTHLTVPMGETREDEALTHQGPREIHSPGMSAQTLTDTSPPQQCDPSHWQAAASAFTGALPVPSLIPASQPPSKTGGTHPFPLPPPGAFFLLPPSSTTTNPCTGFLGGSLPSLPTAEYTFQHHQQQQQHAAASGAQGGGLSAGGVTVPLGGGGGGSPV
uniref:Beta-ureidopropionase n=1 Tax=Chromera velia CCMP2878 TaxID=1169474 RepID=A0A0G4GYZ1_9ALVE|eukprot:Cvel_5431.t1-p1 / transcript=Cvel_5431.t1 / gene=Cvel_5431 / organism=Chromera_velia_CCMP2878 / gene_product=Beta-ureidopropionase, putative / transcript_product=Beta-ureidopropionase, putative / location=Cvel_scaffold253:18698-35969(+) / protein_length=1713 / sequence_SO=supercontig / SO=protein_coding / is_pseudo=false